MVQLFKPSFFQPSDVNGDPLAGGLLYFYETGTTDLLTVYTDSGLSTPNTNPVVADASGIFVPVYLAENSFKVVLKNSAEVTVQTIDPYLVSSGVSGSDIRSAYLDVAAAQADDIPSGVQEVLTSFYASANRTGGGKYIRVTSEPTHAGKFRSVDRYLPNGSTSASNGGWWELKVDIAFPEHFGAVADLDAGNTNNRTALQSWIGYGVATDIPLRADGRYSCTNNLTVSGPVRIHMGAASEIHFATVGTGVGAITISTGGFKLTADDGAVLSGPTAASFVLGEHCIKIIGVSSASRYDGFHVEGVEIKEFGHAGIYAQFVDNVYEGRNHIHNCGYAGIEHLSCNDGVSYRNAVHDITPGTGGVMYGIAWTHDSTDYDLDPNAGTPLADHPFSNNCLLSENLVYDIDWEGIDFHGGYNNRIVFNAIFATRHGISLAESSGAADNYGGYSNVIMGNVVDGRNQDGTTSTYENLSYGIGISSSGAPVSTAGRRVNVIGNHIRYKGLDNNGDTAAILARGTQNVIIGLNEIEKWRGVAIDIGAASGIVASNLILDMEGADTIGRCIQDSSPAGRLTVTGNLHDPGTGTVAVTGFHQQSGSTIRPLLGDNDFEKATTPRSLSTTGYMKGSDGACVILPSDTDAVTNGTLPIAEADGKDCIVVLTSSSTYTVDTITGFAQGGQMVTIINTGTGTATLQRSGLSGRFASAGDLALGQYDSVVLRYYGSALYQVSAVLAGG